MKRVLIISPYFPPSNAADMQRVRTSLPYFKKFGWETAVVAVDPVFSEVVKDELLNESIPADCKIHYIGALKKGITSRLGFGSLAFRAIWHYRRGVARLLKKEKFDLVYFSTTQFPVCVLGPYWKKRFNVPYVIDMQDPWYSTSYDDKPEKPPKYRLVYALHKIMEANAMRHVDGLISVSKHYIDDLQKRYPSLEQVPARTITFGAFKHDLAIANEHSDRFKSILAPAFINIVYIGRGGADMRQAVTPVFTALKMGLDKQPEFFNRLKFWFIGTSYAPAGQAVPTIKPVAEALGVGSSVIEITGRISYYETLLTLQQADALFVPGSDDPKYTASKIYPYLLTKKPLLAIFHHQSSAVEVIKTCATGVTVLSFPFDNTEAATQLDDLLTKWARRDMAEISLTGKFESYSAEALTGEQTVLFDLAINHFRGQSET